MRQPMWTWYVAVFEQAFKNIDDALRKEAALAGKQYTLTEIIAQIDELRFRSQTEKHEPSHLYEVRIRNMGNEVEHRSPREIMDEIAALDAESAKALEAIRRLL